MKQEWGKILRRTWSGFDGEVFDDAVTGWRVVQFHEPKAHPRPRELPLESSPKQISCDEGSYQLWPEVF